MAKAKKTIILMIAFVLMCGFTVGLTACDDNKHPFPLIFYLQFL